VYKYGAQCVVDTAPAKEPSVVIERRSPATQMPEPQMKCPKCRSPELSANRRGFGLGKAVAGGALTGPVGLLAGFMGSGKIKITCLSCGHAWQAGK
jgi:tellurium resistance protein TerD